MGGFTPWKYGQVRGRVHALERMDMRTSLFVLIFGMPWILLIMTVVLVMNPPRPHADNPVIYVIPQPLEPEAFGPAAFQEI